MRESARALRRGGSPWMLQNFAHLAYSRGLGLSSFVCNGSVDSTHSFACSLSSRRGGNRVVRCPHRLAARMDRSEKRHPVVFPGFVAAQHQDGLSLNPCSPASACAIAFARIPLSSIERLKLAYRSRNHSTPFPQLLPPQGC